MRQVFDKVKKLFQSNGDEECVLRVKIELVRGRESARKKEYEKERVQEREVIRVLKGKNVRKWKGDII